MAAIDTLLGLMAALRDPATGCPWDVAQTPRSLTPYAVEEACEVADAVERGDPDDLREELGDLLLQVVFQARMAEEAGLFAFEDVAAGLCAKLIRRHPHVFDGQGRVLGADANRADALARAEAAWARIKAQERAEKARAAGAAGPDPLDGVPRGLPALRLAARVSARAAGYGFDWPDAGSVVAKVREETDEVEASFSEAPGRTAEEVGDLLFAVANLARHAGVDPEAALRAGTRKFERRFTAMAARLAADGAGLGASDLSAMEAAWQAVKRAE